MHTFRVRGLPAVLATSLANFDLPRFTVVPGALWKILSVWAERRQQRLDLLRLNEKMLRDIGITAREARQECRKPFWQA